MSRTRSVQSFCADALMKSWFPNNHENKEWLDSPDGQAWREIAELDAMVVIKSYNNYFNEKYKD